MKIKSDSKEQHKDFNLQLGFKAVQESTEDILIIEGYANYMGTPKGDDYSNVYIDRAGEVVVPAGMDLKWFKKNPVILLNHERDKVIGKAVSVSKKDDGIYIKAEIHKGACEDETFYAIQNGLLRTFSIGFRCSAGEYKEINNRSVYFILKSELRECSVVTIPCNSESMFEIKSLEDEEGFYADVNTDSPTTVSDAINKTEAGEDIMKLALADLLSAAEVEKLKSLGIDVTEEKEISTKQYIDHMLAIAMEAAKESLKAELLAEIKGESEAASESEGEEAGAGEEEAGASEGEESAGGEGEGELKSDASEEDKEAAAVAVKGLADLVEKFKSETLTEEK